MFDKRLHMLAKSLMPNLSLADIGTDHGKLAILAVKEYGIPHVIAVDKNLNPLKGAEKNIKEEGLEAYITCRLGDGFSVLEKAEVQQAVIAGVGNGVMLKILEEGKEVWRTMQHLVLSPHQHPHVIRRWAQKNGLVLIDEHVCMLQKHYYVALQYKLGNKPTAFSERELYFGPYLLQKHHLSEVSSYFKRLKQSAQTHYKNLEKNLMGSSSDMLYLETVFGKECFHDNSQ